MFDVINNTNFEELEIDFITNYIKFIVEKEKLDNCLFNVIFIDNKEIREINREYRKIDSVTDVITFALEDNEEEINPELRILGDIYISLEKAYEQAKMYNHSDIREICFLITHGILHLLGFDHMNEEDEKIMFDKQRKLLEEYEIKR